MNIYIGHSNDIDFMNELYKPIRENILNNEHHFVLPHEYSKEPFNSKECLKQCDLFIAEVSSKSTGLGIELGWANIIDVPIICFYKKGFKPSSSLKVISKEIIEYENKEDLINKIRNIIRIQFDQTTL